MGWFRCRRLAALVALMLGTVVAPAAPDLGSQLALRSSANQPERLHFAARVPEPIAPERSSALAWHLSCGWSA